MSDIDLPPALAPYRKLIQCLLPRQSNCCCQSSGSGMVAYGRATGDGGGDGPIVPQLARKVVPPADNCSPEVTVASTGVVALVSLRKVAEHVANEKLRTEMIAGFDRALTALIDDYCGTPPHPHWLGTQADIVTLIGALGVVAESFPDAQVRESILNVAARIAEKSALDEAKQKDGKGAPAKPR